MVESVVIGYACEGAVRMRAWKRWVWLGLVLVGSVAGAVLGSWSNAVPEGAVLAEDVVSYCVGDAGSGEVQLFAIAGRGSIETGEACGERVLVCEASALEDLERRGYIPAAKIVYSLDLAEIFPMKIQLGDVNGDGVCELAICVYKTTKFHPIMAKRPFFFDLVDGNLIPIWLGSRLSRPFDDYVLRDMDEDGICEVVSTEWLEDGRRVVAVYDWRGFGFELTAQSEAFDGTLSFEAGETAAAQVELTMLGGGETRRLTFLLVDGELIYE